MQHGFKMKKARRRRHEHVKAFPPDKVALLRKEIRTTDWEEVVRFGATYHTIRRMFEVPNYAFRHRTRNELFQALDDFARSRKWSRAKLRLLADLFEESNISIARLKYGARNSALPRKLRGFKSAQSLPSEGSAIEQPSREAAHSSAIPDPPKEFVKYRIGNLELPTMNLFGSPKTPFAANEVKVTFDARMDDKTDGYPAGLAATRQSLFKDYVSAYGLKSRSDRPMPRLVAYEQAAESADDKRGKLTLKFALTTFSGFLATNRSLDRPVIRSRNGQMRTIREAYVTYPYALETSVLANPLSSEVVVLSRSAYQVPRDQVLIRLRSGQVALFPNHYQVAAAGLMSITHTDSEGRLSPFVTAIEEANQEIADHFTPEPKDFKLIGIAVNWQDMDLNAYGFIETGLPITDLVGDFKRDAWEGWIEGISFDPGTVLSHLSAHKWEPVSALAMCATLLAFFPRAAVEHAARAVPPKSFWEWYE